MRLPGKGFLGKRTRMMPNEEKAIAKIRGKLARLSTVMTEMFQKASSALEAHDEKRAEEVIEEDEEADGLETELAELCLRFLALYAPKAHDLRYAVSVIRLATDMERVADHSTAMGKAVVTSHLSPLIASRPAFKEMLKLAAFMLDKASSAVFSMDSEAWESFEKDLDNMKSLGKELEKGLVEALGQDPDTGLQAARFLEVIRRVERVGGHARNIAVMVPYITEGKLCRHKA
jgi:phosphate transport system protein